MRVHLKVVVPAVGVIAVLTGSALTGGAVAHRATAQRATAGPQTYTINVDARNPKVNESFLDYYPDAITVHAGDTVVFHYVGVGEPHTVTFGTLANTAVKDYRALSPKQQESNNPPEPFKSADAALPSLFPNGPGDAVQSVANPCFQQSGTPGTATCPNSQHEQPDFNGTQSYYNSGWLKNNEKFTVHLSSGTSPGTYRFMCLLHREDMAGKITVVAPSKTVMSPAADTALGQKQLAADEAPLVQPAALLAKGLPPIPHLTLPGQNPVLVGSGAPGANTSGSIDQFGPRVVKIPVGGSVTWWIVGDHSITFNSNSSDDDIQSVAPDGTSHLNPKALLAAGGPGEPPPSNNGPKSGIHFKLVASQAWNGQGFHNSGVFVNSDPPVIEGYKLKFTHAGTYKYICTVHDNMKGTVVVGGG